MSVLRDPMARPGLLDASQHAVRLVAYFPNAATGNSTIQFLQMLGVRGDQLGVTTPSRMPRGQGMLLSIAVSDPAMLPRIEDHCRRQGAEVHREPPKLH
jgi:hypothetical protein